MASVGLILFGIVLIVAIVLFVNHDDMQRLHLDRMLQAHPDQTQPVYDRMRLKKAKQAEFRYFLFGLNVLLGGVVFALDANPSAQIIYVFLWAMSLLYHYVNMRGFFDFWRPYKLRQMHRTYHLRDDRQYVPGDDGELHEVKIDEAEPTIRYELTLDGELIEVVEEPRKQSNA